jgi:hypothetical protein
MPVINLLELSNGDCTFTLIVAGNATFIFAGWNNSRPIMNVPLTVAEQPL